jgi:D,D-heptose 1,7-bisphosphate phosphatase
MISHAVILCGGAGTRMQESGYSVPKFLLPVAQRALASYCLENLSAYGIKSVHLLLGIDSEKILEEVIKISENLEIKLTYSVEEAPRGTGGALLDEFGNMPDEFLLLHGDLLINTDLTKIVSIFNESNYDFAQIVHPSSHVFDSDMVDLDDLDNIRGYRNKPHVEPLEVRNFGNAGIYAFKKKIFFDLTTIRGKLDLDRDLLPLIIAKGFIGKAIKNYQFIKDIGTPERYERTLQNLDPFFNARKPKPAIFLDRDGTINQLNGFITKRSQIKLIDGVSEAIFQVNKAGYLAIVITNQPVIARGEVTRDQLNSLHAFIEMELAKVGAIVNGIYYCPHHPEKGFEGEVKSLKVECNCRKPRLGLLERATSDFSIDLQNSWMIGDSWRDIELAANFGIKSLKLQSEGGPNIDSDFENLSSAIKFILNIPS